MDANHPVELTITCDNCHAVNLVSATVCGACGVNLRQYRETLPRIQSYHEEKAREHYQELEQKSREFISQETRARKKLLVRQVKYLLLLGVVGAFVVSALAAGAALWYHSRQVKIEQTRQDAVACLDAADYACAEGKYSELMVLSPGYPGAQDGLNQARLGLISQYLDDGLWETAVSELDEYLVDVPGDPQALVLLNQAYDGWIIDTFTRQDYLNGLMLQVQRDQRFSDNR